MSSSATPTASGSAAASSSAAAGLHAGGSNLKIVGIVLAITSGLLIGSSFVFKKKGLLRSQAGTEAGEGVAYLKSPLWWLGMTMMIVGELCNFAAYAFVEALVVTPLGALSVVICAILSSIFLKETLSFFGWLGCGLCILGSIIIALNGPQEASVGQIREFQKLFFAPGFLTYTCILIAISLGIIFYFAPRHGKKTMLWYISVCSMIGGISVSVTTGLGASIVTTAMGDNQFKHWFIYFLLVFVILTLLTEVYYLNVALALFNTAMVTPTYYVIFTFCSMVTTVVLFQGLKASASQIITIVMAFLVICVGITILQMSKVDPKSFNKLDRRSTILLQAARSRTEKFDEKDISGVEDPGMDALRGSFGTVGSIIRARSARKMSQSARTRRTFDVEGVPYSTDRITTGPDALKGMVRHQLYDAPVPTSSDGLSMTSEISADAKRDRRPTIKFDSQEVVHEYHQPGTGDNTAIHKHRDAPHAEYPPLTKSTPPTPADDEPKTPIAGMQQKASLPSHFRELDSSTQRPQVNTRIITRPDAREVFSDDGPLSTIPSSDSSSSDGKTPWGGEEERRERERTAKGKTYPKGYDDKEETIRLWNRSRPSLDDSASEDDKGIRLVEPSSKTNL